MEVLEALVGPLVIGAVLWDVFQTVVVPRPALSRVRIARSMIRYSWRVARWFANRSSNTRRRDSILGMYAPAVIISLLATWIAALLLGLGLVVLVLRDQVQPVPHNLGEAIYVAGTAMLTIGFGDFVPTSGISRLVFLFAGGLGLGIFALTITYLFSLYGAFQRREINVVTLDSRAGAPPSGVALLETYARLGLVAELPQLFAAWEVWAAEVLDSHVAYPILGYFRSAHDNESWVASLGAVLDAATLVMTTIENVPRGHAELMAAMGEHLVEDVGSIIGFANEPLPGVARLEFEQARQRLAASGYVLTDSRLGWRAFSARRSHYASRLNLLAEHWVSPPSQWIGDRAPTGHHVDGAFQEDAAPPPGTTVLLDPALLAAGPGISRLPAPPDEYGMAVEPRRGG